MLHLSMPFNFEFALWGIVSIEDSGILRGGCWCYWGVGGVDVYVALDSHYDDGKIDKPPFNFEGLY